MRVLISIICSFTLYFLLVTPVSAQDTNLTAVKQAFDAAGLLHDVPLGFDPTVLLGVTYFSPEARPKTLYSGIQMAMKETYPMPIFSVVGNPGLGPLVLAMIDPDASSRPTPNIAEIRHFLQGGYAFDPISGLLNALPSVSGMPPYHHPRPSVGSGLHRYAFYLYKQSVEFVEQTLINSSSPTAHFNLTDFALRTNLGDPIGGTFMLVGPDP